MTHVYLDYPAVITGGMRIYQLGEDKLYPSITTILGHSVPDEKKNALEAWKQRLGEKKANEVSKAAADRGTAVHALIERHLKGETIDPKEYQDTHYALFRSLRLELKQINKVIAQEVVLYSDAFQVAGRCDLVCEYKGEMAIVDYKTSSRVKSREEIGDYWLQAAFYAIAHNEMTGSEIKKLVIMMGVENKLPMIFRQELTDELVYKLAERTSKFYEKVAS